MKEPTLFFNNVLQGEFEQAGITLGRFAANTTLGLGGLPDVANHLGLGEFRLGGLGGIRGLGVGGLLVVGRDGGLRGRPADFGQTLFTWGFDSGPYLILPLLGPSNPRDAIGMGIDSYSDPFTILAT